MFNNVPNLSRILHVCWMLLFYQQSSCFVFKSMKHFLFSDPYRKFLVLLRGVSRIFFIKGRSHFKGGRHFFIRRRDFFLPHLKIILPLGNNLQEGGGGKGSEHLTKKRLVWRLPPACFPMRVFFIRGRNILFQNSSVTFINDNVP